MFKNIINKMEKCLKPLGCEIRGIDLKTENRPEGNICNCFIVICHYKYYNMFLYL